MVAAVAASSCAGPQSALVSIDGRDYFVPRGKRTREYGPGRTSGTPGDAEREIVRALARISDDRLKHDSRLQRVAERYFEDLTEDRLPGEALSFLKRYHGLTEASVWEEHFAGRSDASLVSNISDWGRRNLRAPVPPNRIGVVVRPVRDRASGASVQAVLLFAAHYFDLDPIRQRVKRGEVLRLRGRLLPPFVRPKVFVTAPGGAVAEIAVADGGSIDVALPTDRRGQMDVQVSAEYAGVALGVAAFPIWVGRSPPSRLRLPRAESSEAFAASTIRLANEERSRLGLAPLELLPLLGRIALARSHDAADPGSSGPPDVVSRLRAARFCGEVFSVSASGWRTAEGLHRAEVQIGLLRTLSSPDVTHMGVGAVAVRRGGDRNLYTTSIFARRGWTLGRASCQRGGTANEAPTERPAEPAPPTEQSPPPAAGPPPAPASPSPAPAGLQHEEPAPIVPNRPSPPIVSPGPPAGPGRSPPPATPPR